MSKSRFGIPAILLLGLLCLAPVWLSLSQDEEGLSVEVLDTVFHARALEKGLYPFWNPYLALGAPHPLSQSLIHHPFLPLSLVLPTGLSLAIIYQLHLWLGMFAIDRLSLYVRMSRVAAFLSVVTYALCASTLNAFVVDFWPIAMVMWSLLPCLLYLLIRLFYAHGRQNNFFYSLSAGLCAGLLVLNGHLGTAATYFTGLFFFALACLPEIWREKKLPWLLLFLLVVFLLVSSRIYDVYLEYSRSSPLDKRIQSYVALNAWTLWMWPLKSPWSGNSTWFEYLRSVYRNIALGGPYALLACIGLVYRAATPVGAALAWGILACLGFWFLPPSMSEIFAANYQIRDPLVVFAILLAGLAFTRLWASWPKTRKALIALACLQIVILCAGYAPFWWSGIGQGLAYWRGEPARSLYHVFDSSVLRQAVAVRDPAAAGRIAMSPEAEKQMFRSLTPHHFAAFALSGHKILNAYLKGVSYQEVYPNRFKMTGQIKSSPWLVTNGPLLDVLGIRFLIAGVGESVTPGLLPLVSQTLPSGCQVILYENDQAWPEAVVVDARIKDLHLETVPGCGHDGLLCLDFSPILPLRENVRMSVRPDGDGLVLSLEPDAGPRTLLVNTLYREGWRAHWAGPGGASGSAPTFPLFGALIGVNIPPGTETVSLSYRPAIQVAFTVITWTTLVLAMVGLAWMVFRGSHERGSVPPGLATAGVSGAVRERHLGDARDPRGCSGRVDA